MCCHVYFAPSHDFTQPENLLLLCVLLARHDNAGPRCRETDADAEASNLPVLAFLTVFVGPGVDRSRFATAALSPLDITAHS